MFNDPSEQTVYAEWSSSESIWASLSRLLFAGALSSQFLTECVNFILPAGRTLELNCPPTPGKAAELTVCESQGLMGKPGIRAAHQISNLSLGSFAPWTAQGLELVELLRAASYRLKTSRC